MHARSRLIAAALAALHAAAACQTISSQVSFTQAGTPSGRAVLSVAVNSDGVTFAADNFGLLRSTSDLSTWTEIHPGFARALAVGPAGELYVATPDSVLKTTDEGRSWTILRTGGPNDFFSLAVSSAGALLLGDRQGVLKSSAADTGWTRVLTADVAAVLLFERTTGDLFAYESDHIDRSTDGGTTWTTRRFDSLGTYIYALAADSAGFLYAGTSLHGVYRSTDRGASWSPLQNALSSLDVVSVAAGAGGRVYAGLRTGLMVSDDHGETWTFPAIPAAVPQVFDIAPGPANRLCAATAFGLLFSPDHGASWQMLAPRSGVDVIYGLTLAPDGWLYALTSAGVHRSRDSAATWSPASAGFDSYIPAYLTIDSAGRLFGGGYTDNFRSTDHGSSWQPLALTLDSAGVIDMLAGPSGRLFAATYHGILASTDLGLTWTRIDSGLTNIPRVLARSPGGVLYAGCTGSAPQDFTPVSPAGTVYASADGGAHWTQLSAWMRSGSAVEVTSFAFSDSGTILAGTANGGVYRSTDRGATWTLSLSGSDVSAVAIDSQDFCYAGGSGSLVRSTDDGRSWAPYAPAGITYLLDPVTGIVVDRAGMMAIATLKNIFRSTVPLKELPDPVALSLPSMNAATPPDSVRLTWHPGGPAVQRYWFEIAVDSLFTGATIDSLLTDTSRMLSGLSPGSRYWWRVRAQNRMGWGPFSTPWSFTVGTQAVEEHPSLPARFALHQNYPNPFNPTTVIRYDLPRESSLSLRLYNTLGQEVLVLAVGRKPAGSYAVLLDGSTLPSGVYFCRMTAGAFSATRKVVLLK